MMQLGKLYLLTVSDTCDNIIKKITTKSGIKAYFLYWWHFEFMNRSVDLEIFCDVK